MRALPTCWARVVVVVVVVVFVVVVVVVVLVVVVDKLPILFQLVYVNYV